MQHCKNILHWTRQGQVRYLAHIAGRANLPGSADPGFPQYLSGPKGNLPYIIQAKDYDITQDAAPETCAQAIK